MSGAAIVTIEGRTIVVTVDHAAGVVLGSGVPVPDPKRPLIMANKANASNRTRMRQGSEEWLRIKSFEQAVTAAAMQARKDWESRNGKAWEVDGPEYHLALELEFGDRLLTIRATPGRPRHTRRQTAAARAKSHDVDGVKSILDALEGVLFDNDNRVVTLTIAKRARADGVDGDRIRIVCLHRVRSAGPAKDGRQTDRHAKRGALRAAESSASRPSPRPRRST